MTDDWDADGAARRRRQRAPRGQARPPRAPARGPGRAPGRGRRRDPPRGDRPPDGDVEADRVPRPARARERAPVPRVERGRPVGRRRRGVPAPASPDAPRGDGRVPLRAARDPLRGQVRAPAGVGVPEARGGPARGAARARRTDPRRPRAAAGRPRLQPPRRGPHPRVGGSPGRALPLRAGAVRRQRARAPLGRGAPLPARAVAGDARAVPDRLRRDQGRAADVQGRADPRPVAHAADVRGARGGQPRGDAPAGVGHHRRPAGDRGGPALRGPR